MHLNIRLFHLSFEQKVYYFYKRHKKRQNIKRLLLIVLQQFFYSINFVRFINYVLI
jgi:hypothetical protein